MSNRIVVLIDMDCFFCQVETRLRPEYNGKPLAVVQYNQWQLGGIIAVNYEAREFGVTRHMRGEEAKEKCPDLILASVPCLRGKSDTSRYRTAGREVINVISKHCNIIERASVDEAYLDITDIVDERMSKQPLSTETMILHLANTYVVGYSEVGKNNEEERKNGVKAWVSDIFDELQDVQSQKLAVAGMIVEELRADIYDKTGFRCSAGIAQNKILAKLSCGLHKPNRQTILPAAAVSGLYSTLPVKKVRNLGGKFGDIVVESLRCNVMGDLLQYSLQYLQKRFDEKTGLWLYNIARGVDNEPVTTRLVSKSIGACKKFPGKQAIVTLDVLKHWTGELAAEVCERLEQDLEENERRATLLTVSFHYYQNRNTVTQSRSCALNSYKPEKVASQCIDVITKSTQCPIAFIGVSAGKFVRSKGSGRFINFFKGSKVDAKRMSTLGADEKTDELGVSALKSESNVPRYADHDNITDATANRSFSVLKQNLGLEVDKRLQASTAETNESPTSRKVKKLIKVCSDQGNMENDITLNSSPVDKKLDHKNFKESFFMNIFRPMELTMTDDTDTQAEESNYSDTLEEKPVENSMKESLLDDATGTEKQYLDSITCEDATQNSIKHRQRLNDGRVTNNFINRRSNEHGESSKDCREVCERNKKDIPIVGANEKDNVTVLQPSSVDLQEIFPDLDNIDTSIVPLLPPDLQQKAKLYLQNKCRINKPEVRQSTKQNQRDKENPTKTNVVHVPPRSTSNITDSSKETHIKISTVRLQDIFPDLNDIDVNILSLLPPDLQDEARLYINGRDKTTNTNEPTKNNHTAANSKSRSSKSKSGTAKKKRDGPMANFLIKRAANDVNDETLKKCMECNQMIPVARYNEHIDFHVAQNLQNELNKSLSTETRMKRKSESPDRDGVSGKRRQSADVQDDDKNCRLITNFLL